MNVLRFGSVAAWSDGVATFWRDRLRRRPALKMCLPSGLTPNPVYDAIAESVAAGEVSFARASVHALDEFGGLAPDDPGRTRHMLMQRLIGRVDLPEARFRWLALTGNVDEECRRYDEEIGAGFDLVVLGIGTNGHLGMNEPGSRADSPTRRVQLHQSTVAASARYFSHDRLPTWGVTVGLGPILGSREVWVLATGASKAGIIRRTVAGEVSEAVPASLLRNHPNCSIFVDGEAGAALG